MSSNGLFLLVLVAPVALFSAGFRIFMWWNGAKMPVQSKVAFMDRINWTGGDSSDGGDGGGGDGGGGGD